MHTIKKILQSKPLPDKGYALDYVLTEDNIKMVWKHALPKREQSHLAKKTKFILYVGLYNEVLACMLDKALGTNVVPETVPHEESGCQGTLRIFVPGITLKATYARGISIDLNQAQRLAVFDYIVSHGDRWGSNVIVSPDGRLWGIDNACIMVRKPMWSPSIHFLLAQKIIDDDLKQLIFKAKDNIIDIMRMVWNFELFGIKGSDPLPLIFLWRKVISLTGSLGCMEDNLYKIQQGCPDFETLFTKENIS